MLMVDGGHCHPLSSGATDLPELGAAGSDRVRRSTHHALLSVGCGDNVGSSSESEVGGVGISR
ncbi:hypothetical protein E2562_011349 [Oryza meyeriana var. granulata]|uniref:Uncharacterized protein n=1 Tax=Oryza meyeriana var. granulata TaxID=110450 RepID=A0A6G1BX84_9ORYZ|nr:hypothetical protein E2562_011349 [Oryza meyeriana var. granulata]